MQTPKSIKEFDAWIVDYWFLNACKMLSDGNFEVYDVRTGEIENKTFSGLPSNLKDYLKRRWPNNDFEGE